LIDEDLELVRQSISNLGNKELVIMNNYWKRILNEKKMSTATQVHLAIFREPYLKYILEGKKIMESRFSRKKIVPYKKLNLGDIILLKRSGGPLKGIASISNIHYFTINNRALCYIKKKYTKSLFIKDQKFWADKQKSSYATIFSLDNVVETDPIYLKKRFRSGWIKIT
jgi:hypothetical protein